MTSEYDVCDCGHCRVNHHPTCCGVYADAKWETPNTLNRDCNCPKFVLSERYKELKTCSKCGHILDENL